MILCTILKGSNQHLIHSTKSAIVHTACQTKKMQQVEVSAQVVKAFTSSSDSWSIRCLILRQILLLYFIMHKLIRKHWQITTCIFTATVSYHDSVTQPDVVVNSLEHEHLDDLIGQVSICSGLNRPNSLTQWPHFIQLIMPHGSS